MPVDVTPKGQTLPVLVPSDTEWLVKWRKGNKRILRHMNVYEERDQNQRRQWDLMRMSLRAKYGDLALDGVRLVAERAVHVP